MPEEPSPRPPEPAIPVEPLSDDANGPPIDTSPPMPISEPGVIAPAPFAQVYAPAPGPDEIPVAAPPPPPAQSYYPPAYPQPGAPAAGPAQWGDPVAYRSAGAGGSRRPGIITAIGVTAIIFACLSGLTSLFSGCTALVITTNARQTAAMARTTAATTPGVSSTFQVGKPAAYGLPADQRQVVIDTLAREMRQPLLPQRKRQLDAFLTEHGKQVFDTNGDTPLTSQDVTTQLGQTGREFAYAGKTGPDFFVIKSQKLPGRLLLKDDGAVYKPDDLSPNLTSSADAPAADADEPVMPGLTPEEADAVISRIRTLSNERINPAQVAALNGLLQSPAGGNWIGASSTIPGLTAQVKSAAALSDGTLVITFNMGKLRLNASGNVAGGVPAAPSTAPASTPPNFAFAMGTISVNGAACALAIVDGALSLLLAIYLLVIGILTFRPDGAPRRLYVIYALAKLACGLIGVAGFSWIVGSLGASGPPGFAQAMVAGFKGMASGAVTLCAFGLAYPIAVLLALFLSKSARDYYKTAG